MGNRWGKNGNSVRLYFLSSKITTDGDCGHEIKRCLLLGRKAMINLDSILKVETSLCQQSDPSSQSYVFSSSHVWMSELDYEESWVPKKWCFWTVVGEDSWESPGLQAAAAAKSLQSCPTLCDPRWQPTRLPHPWDSPGKNTGVGCHFLLHGLQGDPTDEF